MSALQINDCCTTLGHAAHSFFIVYRRSGDYYMRGHFFKIEKSDVRRKWAQWAHTYTTDKKKMVDLWFGILGVMFCSVALQRIGRQRQSKGEKKHISILRCSRIKITNERNKKKKEQFYGRIECNNGIRNIGQLYESCRFVCVRVFVPICVCACLPLRINIFRSRAILPNNILSLVSSRHHNYRELYCW